MNKIQISQKRLDRGLYWERAWSLINGCTKVSEGCENCWAERLHNRFGGVNSIDWKGNIRIVEDNLELPLKVKKPTVWCIWNDLFHEKVSENFIDKVFSRIYFCDKISNGHIFLILTKRPERMKDYLMRDLRDYDINCEASKWVKNKTNANWSKIHQFNYLLGKGVNLPLKNIWLGVTTENQRTADERIPILLQIPAAVRFVSIEPCLSEIDLTNIDGNNVISANNDKFWNGISINKPEHVNWVICGAESGSKKRPCNIEWVRNIKNQCKEAGVPLFIKQIHIDGKLVKDINKFPEDLRIREFPK